MQDFHVYLPKMMTKVQRIKRKGSKSNLLKYQICPPNDTLIVHRDIHTQTQTPEEQLDFLGRITQYRPENQVIHKPTKF